MFDLAKITIVSLTLIAVSTFVYSEQLIVGIGNFEPFFMKDGSGPFMELTQEVFELMPQYKVKYIAMPNARLRGGYRLWKNRCGMQYF